MLEKSIHAIFYYITKENIPKNDQYVGETSLEKMAHLGGESSNTLFDILAQWNQVLSVIQIPANAPERDICGVAR